MGCTGGFQAISSSSFGSFACIANVSQSLSGQLSRSSSLRTSKIHMDMESLDSGAELAVLVDNNCAAGADEGMSQGFIASEAVHSDLTLQAYAYELGRDMPADQLLQEIQNDDCIVAVSENSLMQANAIPNDAQYADQLHMPQIRAAEAWDIFYDPVNGIAANQETVVAIVDTGIDYNHPDLENQMWVDGNGNFGRDFINNDDDPFDDNLHGTHVAGLVGAEMNNNIGVSGVIGPSAKLMAVKVLDDEGSGSIVGIANGINYAVENEADIINLSLGGRGASPLVQEAMLAAVEAGITVVVAAGNDGEELSDNNFMSPIGYAKDTLGIIGVGATRSDNRQLAGFSNFSDEFVEIAAPGEVGLLSTFPDNNYQAIRGTSMATPLVAGAAALTYSLLRTRQRVFTPAHVEEVLLRSSVPEAGLNNLILDNNHLDLLNLGQLLNTELESSIARQPASIDSLLGSAVNLDVQMTDELFVSYQWQKDGVDIEDATSASYVIPQTTEEDSGNYRVKISQLGKESFSQVARVRALPACP